MKRRYLCAVLLFLSICSLPLSLIFLISHGVFRKLHRIQEYAGIDREASFAIEFTVDRSLASVTLIIESTYSLTVVPGNSAYQTLMRQYQQRCHQAYLEQPISWDADEEYERSQEENWQKEARRRHKYFRKPETSWWDYIMIGVFNQPRFSPEVFEGDEYSHDLEVDGLAKAVQDLKSSMAQEMTRLFNATESLSWGYASIVAPNFLFTAEASEIDPYEDAGWTRGLEASWLRRMFRKFSVAVYRNKFRLDENSDWRSILYSYYTLLHLTPASHESLSHTRKHHCIHKDMSTGHAGLECGRRTLSPTSIVVDFANDSLSLWAEGPQTRWTPWNTFPELGHHNVIGQHGRAGGLLEHWSQAADKTDILADHLSPSERGAIDLVYTGQFWTDDHVNMFEESLEATSIKSKIKIVNEVRQPDTFAASKRTARWGRHYLDTWMSCSYKDIRHDEL